MTETGRRWSWRAALTTWPLAVVAVVVFLNVTGPGWLTLNRLVHEGLQTTATVVRLEPNNHNGCTYAYVIQGRRYTGSDEGCGGGRKVGDPLTVTYVPADPASSTSSSPGDALRVSVVLSLLLSTVIAGLRLTRRAGRPQR